VSGSLAVCLGCAVPHAKNVTEMGPLLFVPQLLFAGFFVRISQIPLFLQWVQYLCSLKYAMNLALIAEFNGGLKSCQGAASNNCELVLSSNQIVVEDWPLYVLLLVALFVVFRLLGAIVLMKKASRFY